ncbi:UvrD-helicase domain-containing protein [Evansella tamaricis]|uniref:DNA 3'-5' helicase n=1 Tax=Evansella tamaricis TaxID=2069301 RepID=A0ABS6J9G8_9BACI|nr:UvrD-helicase domain-containing protein [Evansella tamaricis]MBU9710148.1 UvrD-helicase domain-containing protein [Evansella tamaricis]
MSNRILDQGARDMILENVNINILVEAGAGSGKTTSLVGRIVNLIYSGAYKVEEIVAITFTRKAADELKVRFQSELEKRWKKESNPIVKARLAEALQNIDQCFLGTVHAFCARLLRERPIEAKLDLVFTELEEEDDNDLLEEAWHQFLQVVQDDTSFLLKDMEELGIQVDDLFGPFKELKEYPDVKWVSKKVSKPDLKSDFDTFLNLIKEAKKCIPDKEPDKGYDPVQKSILTAIQKVRHMDSIRDKDRIEIFELFNKKLKPTLKKWSSNEDAKFYSEKIAAFFEVSIAPLLKKWKEYCHPKIISFLRRGMNQYQQLKRERSLLNFQDLLINTRDLLKDHSEVRSYFQKKYRTLLIDEFQDTDPIQAEIMFFLTGKNTSEKVWTNCKPRPGSLFVVGDPKQAIYRFRRADMDTYNRVKKLILAHGGKILHLTMNFRTIGAVTESLNMVFEEQLPDQETVYQAAYRELNSYHQKSEDSFIGIKRLSIPSEYSKKDDVIAEDARNIAQSITELIEKGYNPSDFMILTRYNDGIVSYAEAIESHGIPVSVSGELIIGEMKEFKELSILLKAFVDPTDELSFLAVLRGTFFGVSDEELYQWKHAGGRFSIYASVPENLTDTIKEKFELTIGKLSNYQKWIRSYSPSVAIDKIMEDVGFYPLLILRDQGKKAYKGILQILAALRRYEEMGHTSFRSVYERFEKMVFEKSVVANMDEDVAAVRIMNIHKAKGLEAKIVYLAHPIKKVDPESFLTKHIKRQDELSEGYFAFFKKTGFQSKEIAIPPDWEDVKLEELRYLKAEETRIVYVAATRSESALILSSSHNSNKNNPWIDLVNIENLEEITLDGEHNGVRRMKEFIKIEELLSGTKGLENWVHDSSVKTYDTWSPTENKNYRDVLNMERDSGGGKEWGSIIHDVLEKVVQGHDVTHYIKNILLKYNQPMEREKEVWKYINHFKSSQIWIDLESAEEVYTEVPIHLMVEKGDPLYNIDSSKREQTTHFVKGIIDLIYKFNGKWFIVDYKTDRPKNEQDVHTLSVFYADQIQFYKNAWEQLTGEVVSDATLYFWVNP